jgi:PAS domain S-box-containing protein
MADPRRPGERPPAETSRSGAGRRRAESFVRSLIRPVLVPSILPFLFARTLRADLAGDAELVLLFEMAPSGMLLLDASGRIVRSNPSASRIFDRPASELAGRSVSALLAPDSIPVLHAAFEAASAPRSTSAPAVRVTGLSAGGHDVPLEAVVGRLGSSGGFAVVLRDLREQLALIDALAERGAELARSNRDLEEFSHVASHDLQEPLRMVASYTQLIAQRYRGKLDRDGDEFLAFAQEGAERMQRLVDDLVTYARVDTRGQPFVPVSMDACLADSLRNLEVAIREAGATVESGPLPGVDADAVQMTQVFQNLVANAVKFHGPAPPQVVVRGIDEGPTVLYSVSDNGLGIPTPYREKIFGIFQRLHRREEYPGTGIGLAVCKRAVERHGGRIWVGSGPSSGSVFYFRLPKHHAAAPPERTAPAVGTDRERARRQAHDLISDRLRELV